MDDSAVGDSTGLLDLTGLDLDAIAKLAPSGLSDSLRRIYLEAEDASDPAAGFQSSI